MQKVAFTIDRSSQKNETKNENRRRRIVHVVILIYWLLIINGALRKWGFPQYQNVLFFIRVPLTMLLYFLSIDGIFWPKLNAPLLLSYILGFAALIIVPLQYFFRYYDARYYLLSGYGWISYFFYIPLIFIIEKTFRREDIYRLIRHTLFLIILEAPLVVLQFNSPPISIVNAGVSIDPENQFLSMGAAMGRIRPNGFFSNSLGQSLFIAVSTIAVLYEWMRVRGKKAVNQIILFSATISLFVLAAFSSSRSAFGYMAVIIFFTLLASFYTGRRKLALRGSLILFILIISFSLLWPLLFPNGYETFIQRWTGAYEAETTIFKFSFFGRALYSFYGWIYYLDGPFFGYLLGIANNAASRLSWVQLPYAANEWNGYGTWATESNWAVHFVELGIPLGFLYMAFRILLTFWVFLKSWYSTKKTHDPLALMFFSFAGLQLLIGLITVQGDAGGFVWLFLGLCLAASKGEDAFA